MITYNGDLLLENIDLPAGNYETVTNSKFKLDIYDNYNRLIYELIGNSLNIRITSFRLTLQLEQNEYNSFTGLNLRSDYPEGYLTQGSSKTKFYDLNLYHINIYDFNGNTETTP